MSDDPTSTTDDELVSAYVDGEATADEVAAVEASPSLLARVEVMRAVAGAVASAPVAPAPDDARETSIARALAAAGVQAEVTDLAAVRARRRLRVLSIAAAVFVALAIGAGLLARAGNDRTSSTAARPSASGSAGSSSSSAAADAANGETAAGAANTFGAVATTDLGDFDDTSALVDSMTKRLATTKAADASPSAAQPATGAPAPGAAADGPVSPVPCPLPADLVLRGVARVHGSPVTVFVYGEEGHKVIEVLDATCAVVLSQPL